MAAHKSQDRIDRLLDAIDLIQQDEKREARDVLRQLIQEDSNFEHAWLWMAVAVETLDQSTICLDNVLRVNPANTHAAGALYRLRRSEIEMKKRRARLQLVRNVSLATMWLLVIFLLNAMMFTMMLVG